MVAGKKQHALLSWRRIMGILGSLRLKPFIGAILAFLLFVTALDAITRHHNSSPDSTMSSFAHNAISSTNSSLSRLPRPANVPQTRGTSHTHIRGTSPLRIRGTSLKGKLVHNFRKRLDCISESGKWVYNATPRALPWNYAGDPYASQCDGRHSMVPGNAVGEWADILAAHPDYGNWTVRETLKWVWRSNSSCPIKHLERGQFCRVLGEVKGNVLVVGDSINHLVQWSLLNNLLRGKSDPQVFTDSTNNRTTEGFRVCGDVLGGDRAFKIGFVRNDRLSTIPEGHIVNDTYRNFLEWPWLHLINPWNIKLLILNKGAHFENDQIYLSSLQKTLSTLSSLHPDLPVIFRDTPPGHENCMSFEGPIADRQRLQEDKYHWSEFKRQNALARKAVEEAAYVYVNADAVLNRRADGHINEKDCLHYCIPGPLDSLVELLFNVLSLLFPVTSST